MSTNTTFSYNAPPPEPSVAPMLRFLQLVNKQWPIDRSIGNFGGNHSITINPECPEELLLTIWVWKQLEWRAYLVGLGPPDMLLSADALLADVVRTATPELEKMITPMASLAPAVLPKNQSKQPRRA